MNKFLKCTYSRDEKLFVEGNYYRVLDESPSEIFETVYLVMHESYNYIGVTLELTILTGTFELVSLDRKYGDPEKRFMEAVIKGISLPTENEKD